MGEEPERLRARARKYILAESFNVTNELSESAGLVSALLAEVERLAGERDIAREQRDNHLRTTLKERAEYERLAGRVAALERHIEYLTARMMVAVSFLGAKYETFAEHVKELDDRQKALAEESQ